MSLVSLKKRTDVHVQEDRQMQDGVLAEVGASRPRHMILAALRMARGNWCSAGWLRMRVAGTDSSWYSR